MTTKTESLEVNKNPDRPEIWIKHLDKTGKVIWIGIFNLDEAKQLAKEILEEVEK